MTQNRIRHNSKGAGHKFRPFLLNPGVLAAGALIVGLLSSCALLIPRPTQDMANAASALRAAREVQADTLAPDLFRRANEWFFKAKTEYRLKNFDKCVEFVKKARILAEQAEFDAIRSGGKRTAEGGSVNEFADIKPPPTPELPPLPKPSPYPYPTPTGYAADPSIRSMGGSSSEHQGSSPSVPAPPSTSK